MTENPQPSKRTLLGLDGMIFCLSDVRPGIGPFLSIFLKSQLHWSTQAVGIALGILDLTAAICQIPSGLLVDSLKFKRFLMFIACLAVSFGCILILTHPTFFSVIAAQILIGSATAIIPPAIASITLGLVGRNYFPKRISINETWAHAGNVFTAGIVGLLGYLWGHEWILYMVIFFATCSVLFLSLINPKEINHAVAREQPQKEEDKNSSVVPLKQFLKKKELWIFCLSAFLFHFANAAQLPLVGQLLATKNPSIDSLFMSACIILAQIVMIAVAYSMGFLMNDLGRKPLFLFALAVLPVRALLYTLTDSPLFLLSIQLLDGIGAGIFGVIAIVTISDIAKNSGRFNFSLGLMTLAQGIGASMSNIFAGFITHTFGFPSGFTALACMGLIGLFFYGTLMPETKPANNA